MIQKVVASVPDCHDEQDRSSVHIYIQKNFSLENPARMRKHLDPRFVAAGCNSGLLALTALGDWVILTNKGQKLFDL